MSGGSHGYLCFALERNEHPFDDDWDDFIQTLQCTLPVQMRALQESFFAFFETNREKLRAVEWWASGDWGPEQVVQAFAEAATP